jgi:hypothetical protein
MNNIITFIVFIFILIFMWFLYVIMSPPIQEVEIIEIIEPEKSYRETVIIPEKIGGRCPKNFRYFCN